MCLDILYEDDAAVWEQLGRGASGRLRALRPRA
jgi:hypothetical protein